METQRDSHFRVRLWISLGGLLIVATWLAIRLPHGSLWYDETMTVWVASGPLDRLWQYCTQTDLQVPLHYLAMRGWMTFVGDSEFVLHLFSALCTLLAVAGLIALGRRLVEQRVGLLAGLLFAFSPGIDWIAYEVRAYALALALMIWATVFLFRLLERPSWRVAVAYGLLALASLYCHYTAIGALVAHAAIVLLWAVVHRRFPRQLFLAGAIVAAGYAPWLPVLFTRSGADHSFFPGSLPFNETIGVVFSFGWLARDDFTWLLPLTQALTVLGTLVGIGLIILATGGLLWAVLYRRMAIVYAVLLGLFPIVILAIIVYFRPKLTGRYAWASWIGIDLTLALGVAALAAFFRGRRIAIAAITALVLIIAPWSTGQTGGPPQSDFRDAFATIRANWHAGDLLILHNGILFSAADYYDSPTPYLRLPLSDVTDVTRPLTLDQAVTSLSAQPDTVHGVWMLSWQSEVMDPQDIATALLESIGDHDPTLGYEDFGDVHVDYFHLRQPLAALRLPQIADRPLAVTPNGVALTRASLLTNVSGHVIVQTWWERAHKVNGNIRISARLDAPDGTILVQIDQPPGGWLDYTDEWTDNTPVLGRYDLTLPNNAPAHLTADLVIYSSDQEFAPIDVPLGTIGNN